MPDERRLPPATALAARLLWHRDVRGPRRRQPIVVLLGPTGAGKSWTLRSISDSCGLDVVHAGYDFQRATPTDTMEVLAQLAFDLSRKWSQRGRPRFARLAAGLIAVQTPLAGLDHRRAKDKLRAEFAKYTSRQRPSWIADALSTLVDAAVDARILDTTVGALLKRGLPELVQAAGRESLRRAIRWHGDHPDPRADDPYDALLDLNRLPAAGRDVWLLAAFLADTRESQARLAKADMGSECRCGQPKRPRHWHNWLLLLDNTDHPDGERFLRDLTAARERALGHDPTAHDPLLVMATSGRWNSGWEPEWRPPWLSPAAGRPPARTVRRCRDAGYHDWAGSHPYYPVLLEPLTLRETAHIIGVQEDSTAALLARRATGGLPAAVESIRPLLEKTTLTPGARDVLGPADNPWQRRLTDLGLAKHAPDLGIEEFVSAAPFATAPWLLPRTSMRVNHRNVGRILTELRTALWAMERRDGSATADPAVLHPWIAGNLVLALTHREPDPGLPSYEEQFTVLLNDFGTDRARRAYCHLALGDVAAVVDDFVETFETEDEEPHQAWVDRLEMVCRAPDALPLDSTVKQLFTKLVKEAGQGRDWDVVRNVVSRLVVANWLSTTMFTVPPDEREIVEHAYRHELPPHSRKPDTSALHNAGSRASDPLMERGVMAATAPRLLTPRTRLRRYLPPVAVGAAAVLVAALTYFAPWRTCGRGLTDGAEPSVCVGLNRDGAAFRSDDPLAALERQVYAANPPRSAPYATIVLLDDMTPDPQSDSEGLHETTHDIEGVQTAVWRADHTSAAGGTTPPIRLLLANFGPAAESQQAAVDAIKAAQAEEHIVAVVGLAESRIATRSAASQLSAAGIATIGPSETADSMNLAPDGRRIENFFRIAPTNTQEVRAAANSFDRPDRKILLVADDDPDDSYTMTLAQAFVATVHRQYFSERYKFPAGTTGSRADYVQQQFADMHGDICADHPDVVYFAGRGTDLKSFLATLADAGSCGLGPIDVYTGDDAANIVGDTDLRLPANGSVRLFYTALATRDEWRGSPYAAETSNYAEFDKAFAANGFAEADLTDGFAIMAHDAALTAATAIRRASDVRSVNSIAPFVLGLHCQNAVPGASGYLAFHDGNPVDKVMPIMQIGPDGSTTLNTLVWSDGHPFSAESTC
ncbi:ABC transporter substrate-binding protein [Kutzneria sp. CA-103260]|uniref:ABC transporter substrate-binding protein n=1 Tax=Kutzneria sp. CA-103260 TaxID=2802641 RepID=UPI001BAD6BCB|nr:ABC transporter substrate-binding protein [Kutzneria sp. CA-103260]QUQ63398.1 Periplasmic binding protein [Kutzneria sp. CA-103260]